MKETVIQSLLDKGMKQEDISRAFGEMSSYFTRLRDLEGLSRETMIKRGFSLYRGRGDEHADILVISDKPNELEKTAGYVGFSDYALYLTIFLNKLGLQFENLYWTCAIKEPLERVSMKVINNQFESFLQKEIKIINPVVIIALGTTAISALAKEPIKIEKVIDEEFYYETEGPFEDIPVIALQHPSIMIEKDIDTFKQYTKQVWQKLKSIESIL